MKLRLTYSESLREQFQREQFVLVPKVLSPKSIQQSRTRAEEIAPYARLIRRTERDFRLVYRVVTGETIQERWPELLTLYQDTAVLDWIRSVTGERAITSPHLQSAVNLNIMIGAESVYRWHFDALPYTALLYLTDVRPEDGGALELIPACKPHKVPDLTSAHPVELWPDGGTLLLMDGTRCYHRVAPLLRPATRFSVPLVYPNAKAAQQRPSGLDSYLYEPAA